MPSICVPARSITRAQRWRSVVMKALVSTGLEVITSAPSSTKRARMSGARTTYTSTALKRSTAALGMVDAASTPW